MSAHLFILPSRESKSKKECGRKRKEKNKQHGNAPNQVNAEEESRSNRTFKYLLSSSVSQTSSHIVQVSAFCCVTVLICCVTVFICVLLCSWASAHIFPPPRHCYILPACQVRHRFGVLDGCFACFLQANIQQMKRKLLLVTYEANAEGVTFPSALAR